MYILASLLFLAVYSIENAFIAGHKTTVNNDLLKQYDELAILGLGILLIIYHLLFIIHIQVTVCWTFLFFIGYYSGTLRCAFMYIIMCTCIAPHHNQDRLHSLP